jgi:hypothetical protein
MNLSYDMLFLEEFDDSGCPRTSSISSGSSDMLIKILVSFGTEMTLDSMTMFVTIQKQENLTRNDTIAETEVPLLASYEEECRRDQRRPK